METRTKILNSAQRLIQTRSFEGFSFQDIADEVGIRKASLYHHFDSKDAVAIGVLKRGADWVTGQLDATKELAPPERLERYFDLFHDLHGKAERMCPGGSFASVLGAGSPAVQRALHAFTKMHLDWLEGVVREGAALGAFEIGEQAPRDVALQIFSCAGCSADRKADGGPGRARRGRNRAPHLSPLYAEGKRGREQTRLAGRRYQGKAYRRKTLRAAAPHGVAMLLRVLPIVISMMGMLATPAWAETLPLPSSLVDADSDVGERLFLESDARQAYFPLAANFLTQKYQSYCGVASIVMVLNALQLPAPAVPEFAPYRTFTQDNVLDERTDAVLPRHVLLNKGMTLDQLGGLLALQLLNVEVRHAGDATLDEFRAKAREYLGQKDHFVIINYLRMAIGQERGGHISPLAAYDAQTDRFLILDVARYKYPPVWVTASDLFKAMNTPDADNENKTADTS